MKFTRRSFIQTVGTSALIAAIPGCARRPMSLSEQFVQWSDREETWKSTVCGLCPGRCGLRVRLMDGSPVQIRGNPLHPVNRGGMCPRGAAALDLFCDSDRLTGPLQRAGRGSNEWRPIAWDAAVGLLAAKLAELRSARAPESLVMLDGQEAGLHADLAGRFARAFGTPNHIRVRAIEPERIALTHELMQGGDAPLGYDLSRAACILSFGTELLESWISPVSQMRGFADLCSGAGGSRGQVLVVSPRMSMTAARADRWVPVNPGTEGALALGIAYVLIREELIDRGFLDRNTFGFEDWTDDAGQAHTGFKSMVLSEYNPLAVSGITGVRPETILSLARTFGSLRPAIAIGEPEYSWGANDFYARMAIHSLNALTGNLAGPGTFAVQGRPPVTPLPDLQLDGIAQAGLEKPRIDGSGEGIHFLSPDAVQAVPAAILAGRPYPVSALVLLETNPVFSHPAGAEFRQALAKVPFVVSTSLYLDETAALADLIIPDASFLERWDFVAGRQHAGFSYAGVGEPAAAPPGTVRDSAETLMAAAGRLGGSVAAAFPWPAMKDVVQQTSQGLFAAERGYVMADDMDESFRRILERQGFRDPEFKTFDDFWNAFTARGAWWDPTDTSSDLNALIHTRSGRFEFYSQNLAGRFAEAVRRRAGNDPAAQAREAANLRAELGIQAEGDRFLLPHHEPLREPRDATAYPLKLKPFLLLSLGDGRMANSAWVQERLAVHVPESWQSWVELNPATAREAGVSDGEEVWVESPRGRVKARVRCFEGTLPGIAAMPIGQGHVGFGKLADKRGANPFELVENLPDSRSGMAVLGQTPVRVVRA